MHIQHKRRCVHHLPCYKEKFGSAQLERTCSAPDELSGRIESLCGEVRVTRLHILRNVVAGNRRPIASRVSGALPRRHHLSNRFGRRLRGRLTGYFVSPPPTSGLSFCETAAPSGRHVTRNLPLVLPVTSLYRLQRRLAAVKLIAKFS